MVGDSPVTITDAEPFNSTDSKFNQVPLTGLTFAENPPLLQLVKKSKFKQAEENFTSMPSKLPAQVSPPKIFWSLGPSWVLKSFKKLISSRWTVMVKSWRGVGGNLDPAPLPLFSPAAPPTSKTTILHPYPPCPIHEVKVHWWKPSPGHISINKAI